ncbi:hypothetical protein AVEN_30664-1 [Araneus ventricosus]|uniref:Uncharacterized protein n=1 Tax=Araneus ventricosus TaxID=182803 RepID=A0A4Y2CQ07_ARAVE|nr:hypothetical protein AVEN_30664-1 [Araneus ventricosus]
MMIPYGISEISYPHAQPYRFGYTIRDHHSRQYREEAGNGVGAVAGSYGYVDGRGNFQYNNYGVGAGYGVPLSMEDTEWDMDLGMEFLVASEVLAMVMEVL